MSMETTCPKCHTTFRVTTEQLNAHQGDVRCGVCATAFNAFDSLAPAREATPQTSAPSPVAPSSTPEPLVPETAPDTVQPEVVEEIQLEAPHFDRAAEPAEPEATGMPAESVAAEIALNEPATQESAVPPTAETETAPRTPVHTETRPALQQEVAVLDQIYADYVKDVSFSEAVATSPAQPSAEEGTSSLRPAVPPPAAAVPIEAIEAIEVLEPPMAPVPASEIQPRPALEAWEPPTAASRKHGVLWGLGSLLLLLVLAAQAGYSYRVELAANFPTARPLLEQACAWGHCSVPLPRNAELLKIESSDLEADTEQPAQVTLASVVSNRAKYAQAYPLLELTLTNQNDQMVARRVFKPAEYLAPGSDVTRGMPANSEISVRLALDLGELNAVGYRLYVFYAK